MCTEIAWGSYDPSHLYVYKQDHFWPCYEHDCDLKLGTTEVCHYEVCNFQFGILVISLS